MLNCVPKTDFEKLQSENKQLLAQLEECTNGADKLIGQVEKAYAEKDYTLARQNIELLYEKHPESAKNEEYKKLILTIEKKEASEQKKKAAEEKERLRLANLNNTGMWLVSFYVDDFGEPTKQGYIRNEKLIRGVFSNTAVQNRELDVKFLIGGASDISIMLYEYAGNNPVKAYSPDNYTVLVQDKNGKRMTLKATNYGDRLSFDKANSWAVQSALMKGGSLKFRITENDTPTTQYGFTIQKADWYDNAYRKLKES